MANRPKLHPSSSTSLSLVGTTVDWGRLDYATARERQDDAVARRLAGESVDTLFFTEHPPVFTVGLRKDAEQNLVWSPGQLAAAGVDVVKTNRGGDITYHGPGQIVGYPIVQLSPRQDLHAYLRLLEEVMIATLASYGLRATRREGKTGIWIETRKIAAIGIAVRRWIAYHGFALNVRVNLEHFQGIVPCGISALDGTVTSLDRELSSTPEFHLVKSTLAKEFWRLWPQYLSGEFPA